MDVLNNLIIELNVYVLAHVILLSSYRADNSNPQDLPSFQIDTAKNESKDTYRIFTRSYAESMT